MQYLGKCVRRWMKEIYAPVLLSTKGKAVVLLAALALLVAGIYGVTQVSSEHSTETSRMLPTQKLRTMNGIHSSTCGATASSLFFRLY